MNQKSLILILGCLFLLAYSTEAQAQTKKTFVECATEGNPDDFCDSGYICCGKEGCCKSDTL